MLRICFILFCAVWLNGALAVSDWQPSIAERLNVRQSVDARFARWFDGNSVRRGSTSVDLAGLLLDFCAVQPGDVRIDAVLTGLDSMLDDDPASARFGNIRWYAGDPRVVDPNGIEFVTRRVILAALVYGARLADADREHLFRFLRRARYGIEHHAVAVSYTNIFLMKIWNLLALGQVLQALELSLAGQRMLETWLAQVRQTGISEFLSPSYYDVDLENLALIHQLGGSPEIVRLARQGLDLVWHDIAINWYPPAQRLGGAHSRDYNRLYGAGHLNQWVMRAGWYRPEPETLSRRMPSGPYDAYAWAEPPPAARDWLERPLPRVILSRWGAGETRLLTHYLGRTLSLGSSTGAYYAGHDQAPVALNLGAGQDVPQISFFLEGRRDYYGQHKTLEAGSGHMKALHLKAFASSVQNGPEALFFASVADRSPDSVALESVLVLPADAEFWLNDERLKLDTAFSRWRPDPQANEQTTFARVSTVAGTTLLDIWDQDDQQGIGFSRQFAAQGGRRYRIGATLLSGEMQLYLNFYDDEGRLIGGEHSRRVSAVETAALEVQAPPEACQFKAWLYSPRGAKTEARIRELHVDALATSVSPLQALARFDFHVSHAEAIRVPTGATLFLRRGEAVAAFRMLWAQDVRGKPVDFFLINDGLPHRAVRLTATHAAEPTTLRASSAGWVAVAENLASDEAFARWRRRVLSVETAASMEGTRLALQSSGLDGPLALRADVDRGQLLAREGAPVLPETSAYRVNGIDLPFWSLH